MKIRFRIKGLDAYLDELTLLSNLFAKDYCLDKALQAGADVVADATKEALVSYTPDNRPYVKPPGMRKGITQIQKTGLIKSFGITPKQQKGNMVNMKTGFDGYNALGQPNVMIARCLESGTSFMPKNPIISKASKKAKQGCIDAMQKSLTDDINKMKSRNVKGL